jgi:hypothetical protein
MVMCDRLAQLLDTLNRTFAGKITRFADSLQTVDPVNDLKPVCPNCHAMIHRRTPPYSLEELRGLLLSAGSGNESGNGRRRASC